MPTRTEIITKDIKTLGFNRFRLKYLERLLNWSRVPSSYHTSISIKMKHLLEVRIRKKKLILRLIDWTPAIDQSEGRIWYSKKKKWTRLRFQRHLASKYKTNLPSLTSQTKYAVIVLAYHRLFPSPKFDDFSRIF